MKILVTGGLGFIGSHTVVELQQQGFEVLIVDDLSNSSLEVLEGIFAITGKRPGFEQVDLKDSVAVNAMFDRYKIESVVHFAASKAVGESMEEPLKYYRNNLFSLINVLQAMQRRSIKTLIFSSSCTVYGHSKQMPIVESESTKKALSPYGNSKQIGEEIIMDLAKIYPIQAVLLRYFNPIGAHDSGHIGESPLGTPHNLLPYLTQTAIGKRAFLSVFGKDYNTPDGTCVRDYIHVMDLANAHVKALERLRNKENKKQLEIFNVGYGRGTSVLELIRAFEQVTGKQVNYQIVDRRPGDVDKAWASIDKANEELGWKPEKNLDEMLKSAWEWELRMNKLT